MVLLACLLVGLGAAVLAVGVVQARQPSTEAADYLAQLDQDEDKPDAFAEVLREPFMGRALGPAGAAILGRLGRLSPMGQREKVRHQLVLAGLDTRMQAEDFLAYRLLAVVAGVALAALYLLPRSLTTTNLAVALILPVLGILGPQSWLTRKVAARKEAIFLDMPDVIDLLAISVEAGVGFEGAMDIVCSNFSSPLAEEFSRTLKEIELGLPRREAMSNLKRRTEVPELSNFVLALTQADALGMPIGRVLHVQAGEMRIKRRQWAREKAGKLPVKILFPLVMCIFPAVIIVVIGPAVAEIGKNFK